MTYFTTFPKIDYLNKTSRNIILKAALIKEVIDRADAFYPYIVKDYERPDEIAYNEYGQSTLDWVIYFSNSIVDPYYQWPMTDAQFKSYVEKKYNTYVTNLMSQISHYKYTGLPSDTQDVIDRKSWNMSVATYNELTPTERSGWTPKYVYDVEYEQNEARRSIRLLNSVYIPQVQQELAKIFK